MYHYQLLKEANKPTHYRANFILGKRQYNPTHTPKEEEKA